MFYTVSPCFHFIVIASKISQILEPQLNLYCQATDAKWLLKLTWSCGPGDLKSKGTCQFMTPAHKNNKGSDQSLMKRGSITVCVKRGWDPKVLM